MALDVENDSWLLMVDERSAYAYELIIDVPILVERQFRLITEDWLPPARVVDIAVLRV